MRDRFELFTVKEIIESTLDRSPGETAAPYDASRVEKKLIDHAMNARRYADHWRQRLAELEAERLSWNPITMYFQIKERREILAYLRECERDAEAFISAIPKTTVKRV